MHVACCSETSFPSHSIHISISRTSLWNLAYGLFLPGYYSWYLLFWLSDTLKRKLRRHTSDVSSLPSRHCWIPGFGLHWTELECVCNCDLRSGLAFPIIQLTFRNVLHGMWEMRWHDSLPRDTGWLHRSELIFCGVKVSVHTELTHSCTKGNAGQLTGPEDLERSQSFPPLTFLEADGNLGHP